MSSIRTRLGVRAIAVVATATMAAMAHGVPLVEAAEGSKTSTERMAVDAKEAVAAVTLAGQVALGGKAVFGARVTLTDAAKNSAVVKTNEKGAFAFASSAAAPLEAGLVSIRIAAPGMRTIEQVANVVAGVPTDLGALEATPSASAEMSGFVRVAGAKTGVTGALVTLTDANGRVATAVTNDLGEFTNDDLLGDTLAQGSITVKVEAAGYLPLSKTVEVGADPFVFDLAMTAVPATVSVSGVVRAAGAKAGISGAAVTLTDSKGTVATVKTNDVGAFSYVGADAKSLAQGPITVKVEAVGYATVSKSIDAGNDPVVVDVDMNRATVSMSGVVRTASAQAGVKATLTLTDSVGRSVTVKTNATGVFAYDGLLDDSLTTWPVTVEAKADGYPQVTRTINEPEGVEANADMTLVFKAMTFTGKTVDTETGLVVPGATIVVTDRAGRTISSKSSDDGTFILKTTEEALLEAGATTISFSAQNFGASTMEIDGAYDETSDAGTVELDYDNVEVSGVVRSSTGAPMQASVVITDRESRTYTATSNGDGSFTFMSNYSNPIAIGGLQLVVTADGYAPSTSMIDLSAGADSAVGLSLVLAALQIPTELPATGSGVTMLLMAGLLLVLVGAWLSRTATRSTRVANAQLR